MCSCNVDRAIWNVVNRKPVEERPRPISFFRQTKHWKHEYNNLSVVKKDKLVIEVNMLIYEISNLDYVNMEYSLTILFRMRWLEPLFVLEPHYHFKRYSLSYKSSEIWLPSINFQNVKSKMLHNVTRANIMVTLDSNGIITYSQRISLTLDCFMELREFPFDKQVCSVVMLASRFTSDNILLRWWNKTGYDIYGFANLSASYPHAVELSSSVKLHEFDISGHTCTYCKSLVGTIGDFSCVEVAIHFRRKIGYYIIFVYVPTYLITAMTWMSFFIDPKLAPARCCISLFSLFSLVRIYEAVLKNMPHVAYAKAIDIWFLMCIIFVTWAFSEFAIMNYLHKRKLKKLCRQSGLPLDDIGEVPTFKCYSLEINPKTADRYSAVLFFGLFFFWNLGYWNFYVIN